MFSKIIRRTHMYLALFLIPWMLMYALSTMAMNHKDFFRAYYGGELVRHEPETELTYLGDFPPDTGARRVAQQILRDLKMEGRYWAGGRLSDGEVTIERQNPIDPKRFIYDHNAGKLRMERTIATPPNFLEELHRRRGYRFPYFKEDAWAFSVDLVIVAMIFWVGSGLWMWWELKSTRRWGALCAVTGIALFGFFLFTV